MQTIKLFKFRLKFLNAIKLIIRIRKPSTMKNIFLNTISRSQYEYYWDFIITNNINEYNNLINDQHSFEDILAKYEKTNVVYHVDLTSFNSNSSAIIENTSHLNLEKEVRKLITEIGSEKK